MKMVSEVLLWPERWSLESLKEHERQSGRTSFEREYLCEAHNDR